MSSVSYYLICNLLNSGGLSGYSTVQCLPAGWPVEAGAAQDSADRPFATALDLYPAAEYRSECLQYKNSAGVPHVEIVNF